MRKTLWSALALAAILILAGCGEQSHTDGSGTDSATYTPDTGYTCLLYTSPSPRD